MSVENNGIGLFGQLIHTVKSRFAKTSKKMQNELGDTEVDFVLIQDDGEPVPEITVEEIEEAHKEMDDEDNIPTSGDTPGR